MDDEQLKPCPHCPDGYVWNTNRPTGATCKTCLGYAVVTLSGSPCAEALATATRAVDYNYRSELRRDDR